MCVCVCVCGGREGGGMFVCVCVCSCVVCVCDKVSLCVGREVVEVNRSNSGNRAKYEKTTTGM